MNGSQVENLTLEVLTSTQWMMTSTTPRPAKKCVIGDEHIAPTLPPEILRRYPSFYPVQTITDTDVALKVTLYVVAMLLDVAGNVLVITLVLASRKMRTPTNVLLVNLAVADLLIGLLCMWVHLGSSITPDWPFGPVICKVNMFAQVTMITTSVLTLTVISIERFFAIVFPLKPGWTLRTTLPIILAIWLIACSIASPQLYVRYLQEFQFSDRHVISCKEKWPEVYLTEDDCQTWKPSKLVYHLFVAVVMFFLPILVMVLCYSVICACLLLRKAPGSSSDNHSKSKKRVVRMLVVVVAVFVVCWTPVHVLELLTLLEVPYSLDSTASFAALYVAYLNSALNPVLYAGFNDNFRRGFRDVCHRGRKGRVWPDRSVSDVRGSQVTKTKFPTVSEYRDVINGGGRLATNGQRVDRNRLQVTTIAGSASTSFAIDR